MGPVIAHKDFVDFALKPENEELWVFPLPYTYT